MSFTYVKTVPTAKHWLNVFIFEANLKIKVYESLPRVWALHGCCFHGVEKIQQYID